MENEIVGTELIFIQSLGILLIFTLLFYLDFDVIKCLAISLFHDRLGIFYLPSFPLKLSKCYNPSDV